MLEGRLLLKSENSCVLAPQYWFSEIIEGRHKKGAVSDSESTEVVRFDMKKYQEILFEEELANYKEKVEFLSQFCPLFRRTKNMKEKSAYFTKEVVTKGCQIIELGQQNSYIYLVCRGKVNLMYDMGE